MSDEMAVTDNASGEDAKLNGEETAIATAVEPKAGPADHPKDAEEPPAESQAATIPTEDELDSKLEMSADKIVVKDNQPPELETKVEIESEEEPVDIKHEVDDTKKEEKTKDEKIKAEEVNDKKNAEEKMKVEDISDKKKLKRRASAAFSDAGNDEFKGFTLSDESNLKDYNRVLERLEAEVSAASKEYTPVRNVMATPSAPVRASKRPRKDTDGSRPSSALSSRSDEITDATSAGSSPASRGRRATTEMSSPLLRVPLERGWRRELVYRAALDAHSRRNADIYYYTPVGKKLRSTREVSEHLSGTGLTLENFSFFKEPLGLDDPEKEIIRDAKLMRRADNTPVTSPATVAPVEGKRTPKPKPPKGVSPEPTTPKSPPAKIRVKSMGSRLSNSGPPPTAAPASKATKKQPAPAPAPTPAADNNNSAAWKKPRPPARAVTPVALPVATVATLVATPVATVATPVATVATPVASVTPPPPPLQSRPAITSPEMQERSPPSQAVQPCSLTCGRGVPTLSCAACLCLYHPACAHHHASRAPFYCKNCRKSTSPTSEPPPLTHKSGVTTSSITGQLPAPVPRRVPIPVPVPVPVPKGTRPEKRVLLRMKAASGGPEGERVWAVAQAHGPAATSKPAPRPQLPQSIVRLNGRRFIVVPRSLVQAPGQHSITIDE